MSYYTTAKIVGVTKENYRVTTLELDSAIDATPGQFLMVWQPGFDEKPFCVVGDNPVTLSVAAVGPFSERICSLKQGESLSFRGPYGKGFMLGKNAKRVLLVGGGYGVAALYFFAKIAKGAGVECEIVIGARKADDLLFESKYATLGVPVHVATDDGSKGFSGRAHELVEKLLSEKQFDCVYSCGPELMMQAVAKVASSHGLPSQLALERYMGCGIGICGKCDAGGGLVCKEGPVYTGEQAVKLVDFGKCHRDTFGRPKKW